jgi:hypothetical protein
MIKALKRRTAVDSIRARRFSIRARVRYRSGDGGWREGRTRNMSRSGVLIQTDGTLAPETPIDLIVELPAVIPGEVPPQIVCHARIVRTVAHDADGALVAAAFTQYTFGRSGEPLATSET